MNVSSSTQVPLQLAAGASHSNCSSHTHAPHATENLFSIDQLFYGTHSRTTYNHSRIVNHFAMLSRTTTNHINLPQQKTFTYHSPLPFLNLQIVCTHILTQLFSHSLSMETPSIRVLPCWGILKYNNSNSTHSTTRSQLTLSLCIPSAARCPGTISPLFTSTLLWNSLPSPIRSASSLHTFRQELQKYLGIPVITPR